MSHAPDEADPYDREHRACALCSWLILVGVRIEQLCLRCEPLSKTPEWRGPLPFLPMTTNRRECATCHGKTAAELARIDPATAVFCRSCSARAQSRRRVAPLEFDRDQTPRIVNVDTLESRPHWFF